MKVIEKIAIRRPEEAGEEDRWNEMYLELMPLVPPALPVLERRIEERLKEKKINERPPSKAVLIPFFGW